MSVVSLLIVPGDQPPTVQALADAARAGDDPIEFDLATDLRTHQGFLPVRALGRETGFEFYFAPVDDAALPPEATAYGAHHIVTRTGSNFEEGRAALIFLKVAARLTGGAYAYPDDAIIVAPAEVASYLDEQIAEYGKYIK